jgi:RNA polymerase sigma-B factor
MTIDTALPHTTNPTIVSPLEMAVCRTADELTELWLLLRSLPLGHPAQVDARNALVAFHMPLLRSLARRYANRGEPSEDLMQVGAVGLIKAVDRFEPERGLAFSTFATPTIVGEIKRHFRDKTWMVRPPRSLQDMRARLVQAREELTHRIGRSPTIVDLAEFMGMSKEGVLEGLEASNAYSAVSIDSPTDREIPEGQTIERRLGILDEGMDLVERRRCVEPLLDTLSERDQRLIFLRFFRGMTQTEIGAELGLSQMHVSRLLSQIHGQLHDQLTAELQA